ncbi:hypothetical protein [Pseudoduganella sp. GCM10020061]|uniref:hypothetical protein n=1 Tax=Pseudoduganella sp. GCM10020061 TaxID=3317345 RepID=UPI003626900D
MSHTTLVLPFSLPPKEIAPDLARHLKAPALAGLLSRTASEQATPGPGTVRQLPHELWLSRVLGSGGEAPSFAHAAMHGYGLDPADGLWFIVHPAHIEIARSHLLLNDVRKLALSEEHSRALFETARPYFEESGLTLAYGDAATWFLRADDWRGLDTASPDAAAGLDISFFMPAGEAAKRFRKLQNEIQMLWHDHPANAAREAAGQTPVNAFWPWGGGGDAVGVVPVHACAAQPWLDALSAGTGGGKVDSAGDCPADAIVYCDHLSAAAIAGDWSAWIIAMEELERDWFAPTLAALRSGGLSRITLVLSGRDQLLETITTRFAQRKFWRRATLDRLLK